MNRRHEVDRRRAIVNHIAEGRAEGAIMSQLVRALGSAAAASAFRRGVNADLRSLGIGLLDNPYCVAVNG